jgi:plasmid stability protein
MATLLVRKLDDALVERLKARAKARGRSAEAEHRAILEAALTTPEAPRTGGELWARSRRYAVAEIPELPHEEPRPARFD